MQGMKVVGKQDKGEKRVKVREARYNEKKLNTAPKTPKGFRRKR